MSKYTTEVRFICETEAGKLDSVGYNDIDSVINSSRSKIFDFNYPIWDNAYKPVLEGKILRHFYTREIAYETYGLWKFKLATKLQEIMPYYNQLYETTVLEFNPLYDVNLTTTHTGEGTNTGTEETVLDGDVTKKTTGGYQDSNDLTKTETMNNMIQCQVRMKLLHRERVETPEETRFRILHRVVLLVWKTTHILPHTRKL